MNEIPVNTGRSRARPPHKPKALTCRNCGGPIELKDERSQMVVCVHCGANLELSGDEQKVLGYGQGDGIAYKLPLGEMLTIDGERYEIIARLCLIEDDDPLEQTHEYYLYSPRAKPLTLGDYRGELSLSWRSRVRPTVRLTEGAPAQIQTYDGLSWVLDGVGQYEVRHVEGALPYVAQAGDRYHYAEYLGAADRRQQFDCTLLGGEVEYGRGYEVSPHQLQQWLGRSVPMIATPMKSKQPSVARPYMIATFLLFALLAVTSCVGSVAASDPGDLALSADVDSTQLEGEFMTEAFEVPTDDNTIRIELSTNQLNNAWMYTQVALVEADRDTVIHVDETELTYYSGVDNEGYSWTEADTTKSAYVNVPERGTYHLLIGGVSGYGEGISDHANHGLRARVYTGARDPGTLMGAFCMLAGSGVAIIVGLWFLGVMGSAMFSRQTAARLCLGATVVAALTGISGTGYAFTREYGGGNGPEPEHPDGISIRQSSIAMGGIAFFRVYNDPRSFQGGGPLAGK